MSEKSAIHWLGYALDDRESLKSDASARVHIYTATQVIEKLLKGYLAFSNVEFKPVHNLALLAAQCHDHNPAFPSGLVVEIAQLPSYKELFRYPDENEIFYPEADEVKAVVLVMNDVLECVKTLTPQSIWEQAKELVAVSRAKYLEDFNPGAWLKDDDEPDGNDNSPRP